MLALVWLFPLLWALYNSFRDYSYTQTNGYLSFGGWTTRQLQEAWSRGQFGLHLKNSLLITIPAVLLTLLLSSLVAFVLARFSTGSTSPCSASSSPPTSCRRRPCSSRSSGCSGRSRCRPS